MKRNKVILRIVVTLAAVLAITFWVGMSSKEVQAAVIEQPTLSMKFLLIQWLLIM